MKTKQLLLAICLLIGVAVNSQEVLQVGKQRVSQTILLSHSQIIEDKDTSNYLAITFNNAQYQHIRDFGSIIINSKDDADVFIEEVNKIIAYEGKGMLSVKFNGGSISGNKILTMYDKNGKYVYINKKTLIKIVNYVQNNFDVLK
jgi:hypothetical protein